MPITIDRLDHFVLTVADIDATCDFYERVLGMRREVFNDGRVALHFNRQKINLHAKDNAGVEQLPARPNTGSADVCFITTQPMETVIAHLETSLVPVLEGPVLRTGAKGPITSVYFRDPDGNLIEVSKYNER
ncbi:VOC family protein [Curvivirga aplysinae]|uniref:VOC family protein n=1 Tax=Curvivirga aplysinae TaxID=2529852 RepID=UPI001C3FCD33|nr:VOC family protein [Curvivirga aplysinae]